MRKRKQEKSRETSGSRTIRTFAPGLNTPEHTPWFSTPTQVTPPPRGPGSPPHPEPQWTWAWAGLILNLIRDVVSVYRKLPRLWKASGSDWCGLKTPPVDGGGYSPVWADRVQFMDTNVVSPFPLPVTKFVLSISILTMTQRKRENKLIKSQGSRSLLLFPIGEMVTDITHISQ